MKIRAVRRSALQAPSDSLLLTLFEGEKPEGAAAEVDRALNGAISQLITDGELKGELNQVSVVHTLGKLASKRVIVAGLGRSSRFSLDTLRQAVGTSVKNARKMAVKSIASPLPQIHLEGVDHKDISQVLTEGALLGLYAFNKYRNEEEREVEEFTVLEPEQARAKEVEKGIEMGETLSRSQNFARDLVNEPSNRMTPISLAERASELSRQFGLRLEVLERKDMERLGMGGLLSVARGSDEPPKLILLRYEAGEGLPLIALAGKGITFDSGGISLKPADKMEAMKGDMAGGAAVMGAMRAISQLKPRANVVGIVPATENMPSGHALKPGDIVTCLNGKRVEVISTDAEGRLILADALAYGVKLGATRILDIATLTGGCVVALGELTSALLGNDQALIDLIIKVSERTGEKFWQLPMFEEYREQLKSDVADLKNTGGTPASTITAAIFLKEFVGEVPWVHIDIAGKELSFKDADKYKGYGAKGATGVGTRTLAEVVSELAGTGHSA